MQDNLFPRLFCFRRKHMRSAKIAYMIASGALLVAGNTSILHAASTGLQTQNTAALAQQSNAAPKPARAQAPAAAPVQQAGQAGQAAQIQMPPAEAMIIMIRSSLVALSQANMTNNYTVLNAMGSENFRTANSAARLGQLFAPFRTNNIDLAPVVFVTPQLSQQPTIIDGKLRLVGFFPTQPMRVDYDLMFEPSGGVWKIHGLTVNLNPVQAAPQQTAPVPAPAPANNNRPVGR
jgi:hypothetical protein